MLALGLDFEATGVNPEIDRVTEIGAVLYDTRSQTFLRVYNQLVYDPATYPEQSEEVVRVTGITTDMLKRFGIEPKRAFGPLLEMLKEASYVVAHNGKAYDKPLLETECKRLGVDLTSVSLPWIDTQIDIPYPKNMSSRKLDHLVSDHDIPWSRRLSHRAIFDVAKMLIVLSQYDFKAISTLAAEEDVTLQAMTTVPWRDGGASNNKAKALGFRWQDKDSKVYKSAWVKAVKKSQVQSEIEAAGLLGVVVIALPGGKENA